MPLPGKILRGGQCALLVLSVACIPGCQTTNPRDPHPVMEGTPPVYQTMPRELCKVVLPEYVIEPPDILNIEGVHIIPKSPYSLRAADVLNIQVTGTLPGADISGLFVIQPGGVINLGAPYGSVKVAGMDVRQAEAAIRSHLEDHLQTPEVSVALSQLAASQGIQGQFLVGPDGTITLGSYGQVSVVGLTLNQAKAEIEGYLSQFLESPEISLNVYAYNSKVYYIVVQGACLGAGVYRFPITGNETVLDAIAQIQGLKQVSPKKIWIARPSNNCNTTQILPVDWFAVTERGAPQTNYQILPGDRVFIAEDKRIGCDTHIAQHTTPLERIMGFSLLGTGTATRLSGRVLECGGNNSGF